MNTLRKCILMTQSLRNGKISLSLFPRHIAKWHIIHNLVGWKDPIEQNKSISLEIKRRIARIEMDYSLARKQSCLCLLERQCKSWHLCEIKMRARSVYFELLYLFAFASLMFVRWKNKLFVCYNLTDISWLLGEKLRSLGSFCMYWYPWTTHCLLLFVRYCIFVPVLHLYYCRSLFLLFYVICYQYMQNLREPAPQYFGYFRF